MNKNILTLEIRTRSYNELLETIDKSMNTH